LSFHLRTTQVTAFRACPPPGAGGRIKPMGKLNWEVGSAVDTEINAANGVRPDCVPALCRDAEGGLWAIAGHSGYGKIGVFSGRNAGDLKKLYDAELLFPTGPAGTAFGGQKHPYPDGPLPRGEVWATGLWIVPGNATKYPGRFYALFHNETGWGAGSTGYTAYAREDGEPDFRHIGLMSSDDRGKTWDFHGWVITAAEPCYTERYRPDGIGTGGQKTGIINLGAGDLSVFFKHDEKRLYCFYSMIWYNMDDRSVVSDKVFVARAKMQETGELGEFEKYHRGCFGTPGNGGAETAIMTGGAEPSVAYHKPLGCYLLTTYNRAYWGTGPTLQVCCSDNLTDWTEPVRVVETHAELSMPYFALCGREPGQPHNFLGEDFDLLVCSNNTDIRRHEIKTGSNE